MPRPQRCNVISVPVVEESAESIMEGTFHSRKASHLPKPLRLPYNSLVDSVKPYSNTFPKIRAVIIAYDCANVFPAPILQKALNSCLFDCCPFSLSVIMNIPRRTRKKNLTTNAVRLPLRRSDDRPSTHPPPHP